MATGVLSYGDLEANFQGFLFGLHMCEGKDPFLKYSSDGWQFSRPFDIRSYVNPNWDESYNPSFYFDGLNLMLMPKSTAALNNLPNFCEGYRSSYVQKLFHYYDSILTKSISVNHLDSLISIKKLPDPSIFNIKYICEDL